MILGFSTNEQAQSNTSIIDAWVGKLQEGKKTSQQVQIDLLKGATQLIKEIQDKAIEKAAEERKSEQKDEEAVEVDVSSMDIKVASDLPETLETSSVEIKA